MIVPVSGKVYGEEEVANLKQCADELLQGVSSEHWTHEFEKAVRDYVGVRFSAFCNSGSSANLLAISALGLQPGDEVITTALNFPTTVNPIIQVGAIPVFVDVTIPEYNVDVTQLDAAFSDKTRAVIFAHTLGRPHDAEYIRDWCREHDLYYIEDCCDALGSMVNGQMVGTFGDLATFSFYPAHNISTEEGGMVVSNNAMLMKAVKSFRDWGRDCWCEPGHDNTCGKRWDYEIDHKYMYSHIGYNLKGTNMAAAIGCAQIKKISQFNAIRFMNKVRYGLLKDSELTAFIPFGYPITTTRRKEMVAFLESKGIATRRIFAGNITRQPAYKDVKYITVGDLHNTNIVHDQSFWIGCWHGLTQEQIGYTIEAINEFRQRD